jgi:hypothetical protein
MKPMSFAILLAAIVGFGTLFYFVVIDDSGSRDCPGHWHTTFAVFVPNPDGSPQRVDFASPRAANGRNYYDLSGGAGMGMSMHMHQEGDERGTEAHGPAQWHLEQEGICVSLRSALRSVEIEAREGYLRLYGAHAQVGQAATWEDNGEQVLRTWIQQDTGGFNYAWSEVDAGDALRRNLQDGESVLVAFGDYDDSQVRAMQSVIPPPISRRAAEAPPTTSAAPTGNASDS